LIARMHVTSDKMLHGFGSFPGSPWSLSTSKSTGLEPMPLSNQSCAQGALLRSISSRTLINLWTLMMFRTSEWCVVRTAPLYLLAFHVHPPSLTKMWGLCRAGRRTRDLPRSELLPPGWVRANAQAKLGLAPGSAIPYRRARRAASGSRLMMVNRKRAAPVGWRSPFSYLRSVAGLRPKAGWRKAI
jgi:hypothetical protein